MSTDWDPSSSSGRASRGLFVLAIAAAGFAVYKGVKSRRRDAAGMRNLLHVDPAVVAEQFAGIPLYPGAELDHEATARAVQGAKFMARWTHPWARMMDRFFGPGFSDCWGFWDSALVAVYAADRAPTDVAAWYDESLASEGWVKEWGKQTPEQPLRLPWFLPRRPSPPSISGRYERGTEAFWITAAEADGGASTRLSLMRMPQAVGERPAA